MKQTQGRQLIKLLTHRPMTTLEMLMTGISTAPWKRISEALEPGETLQKHKNSRGLYVYRVVMKPKTVLVKK